ncbi:MAG TPA: hypothetical protein VHB99_07280 [Pirellulales bacterium]|nr:hypothetical protein [Pirellulales bacterium]
MTARRRKNVKLRRRQGMTIVVAMALMSIAMALSYSVLRTQSMSVQIQANSNLRERARQAAWSGFAAGLRNMHQSSWGGVNSTVGGYVNATDSFSVSYATGDPTLTPQSANYSDYPYRVTLSVTGSAVDPAHPNNPTTHSLRAVVRLAPTQLAAEPANWAAMKQNTIYQWTPGSFTIDWPCRIQGNLYLQGAMSVCPTYPYPFAAVTKYLGDLAAMSGGGTEYRPLSGSISLPYPSNSGGMRNWLSSTIGVTFADNHNDAPTSGWQFPGTLHSYQLYAGGAVYQVQQLGASLKNSKLAPDPIANPLGMYYADGDLSLGDNVSVQGALVARGAISVDGANVSLRSFGLPALAGSTQAVHLPAAISQGNFQVSAAPRGETMQASVQGVVAAFGGFVIQSDSQAAAFNLLGQLIAADFTIKPRTEWQLSPDPFFNAVLWQYLWNSYSSQPGNQGGGFGFGNGNNQPSQSFPAWLAQMGLTYTPNLTFQPNPTPLNYHWKNPNDPIYVPASGDPGLRWDVVSFTDNP